MFLLAAPARGYPALVPEPTPAPTSAPVDLAPLHLPIAFLAFLAVFSLFRCVLPARHLMLTGKYGAPGSNGRGKRAKTETWLSFRITWQAPPAPDPAPSQADAKPQLAPGRGARPRTPHASSLPSTHSGTRQTLPPPGPAPSQADAKPQMAPGPGARPRPPLPPAFKSHPPVSMAKIIMVRHMFRRPTAPAGPPLAPPPPPPPLPMRMRPSTSTSLPPPVPTSVPAPVPVPVRTVSRRATVPPMSMPASTSLSTRPPARAPPGAGCPVSCAYASVSDARRPVLCTCAVPAGRLPTHMQTSAAGRPRPCPACSCSCPASGVDAEVAPAPDAGVGEGADVGIV
ncbi:hypothetical protein B0H11DRAFT_187801 [Mycena galericulata]|nr:hypothetical protein B0H11DRAFT_187801 [Mycena galericulata]